MFIDLQDDPGIIVNTQCIVFLEPLEMESGKPYNMVLANGESYKISYLVAQKILEVVGFRTLEDLINNK